VDAGAYLGDTTLLLARRHMDRTFYLVEPSTRNADFIERVKTDNVRVVRKLLSNRARTYTTNRHADRPDASYQESTTGQESTTADGLIQEKVGVMHYDVEGMELEVVQGSWGLICRDKPVLIVESLAKDTQKTETLLALLHGIGYTAYTLEENCNALDPLDRSRCRNIILLPPHKIDPFLAIFSCSITELA
jgi:FkbM family methyltransferase